MFSLVVFDVFQFFFICFVQCFLFLLCWDDFLWFCCFVSKLFSFSFVFVLELYFVLFSLLVFVFFYVNIFGVCVFGFV